MSYNIRMGIPEMMALWSNLQKGYREGTLKKDDEQLYKKWGNALKKLAEDPFYPSLQTHEILYSGMIVKGGVPDGCYINKGFG